MESRIILRSDDVLELPTLERSRKWIKSSLEIGQVEIKGEVKALDECRSTEIKGLTERVKYQEFANRGILIALVAATLGSAAKVFGLIDNP